MARIQPRRYLPDTFAIEKANKDKRFCHVQNREISVFKAGGWEVYSDHRKEGKAMEGKLPTDTTITGIDSVYMEISGEKKEEWERERRRPYDDRVAEQKERLRDLERGGFRGKVDIRGG